MMQKINAYVDRLIQYIENSTMKTNFEFDEFGVAVDDFSDCSSDDSDISVIDSEDEEPKIQDNVFIQPVAEQIIMQAELEEEQVIVEEDIDLDVLF